MTTTASLWRAAADVARGGRLAAFATVCGGRGSLPMARDAKLLVTGDGQRWGTVGGGCVESDVIEQALEAARRGQPAVVRHTLNADMAGDVGLSCGGTVELVVEPVPAGDGMAALCVAVAEAVEQRRPALVLTALDWGAGPRKTALVGERVVAVGEALSPDTRHPASELSVPSLADGSALLEEPLPRIPRLLLFGGGHVGLEVARMAASAGFAVLVADDRAEFANVERFPWADEVHAEPLGALIDRLTIDGDDYVLAATRGHQHDAEVIARTAGSAARYVGMLGSRRKREVVFRALKASGVPEPAVERVRVPVGEPIGARTPAEIAVSIVAELIRVRRGA